MRFVNCDFSGCTSFEINGEEQLPSPNGETSLSTTVLWDQTHAALCAGEWSKARSLLDDLGQRSDVVDLLLDLSQYERASGKALSVDFRPIIQDRIDLVNDKIETHRPTASTL